MDDARVNKRFEMQHCHSRFRCDIYRKNGKTSTVQLLRDMSASRPASVMSALSALSEMEKPRTRAKAAPKKTPTTMTTRNRATTTRKAASKAPATTKAKAKSVSKKSRDAKAAAPNRPTWKEIIRECISDNKDDARLGVSRFMIKRVGPVVPSIARVELSLF